MLNKEELYQKRVEQIKKQAEEREKNKIKYQHNEEGINWGMSDGENPQSESESDHELTKEEIDKLKKRDDLNDNQKKILKNIGDLNKKLSQLLDKNKTNHTTENDVDIFQLREEKGLT